MEVLFAGDPHLEKLSKFFPVKRGLRYQLQALDDLYKYAVARGIKHIVLPGDIFETAEPEQKTVREFLRFLKEHDKVIWYLTRGNHDFDEIERHSLETVEGAITDLGALKHVRVYLSPTLVDISGVPFLFLPFPYFDIRRWLKKNDFAIVVPHLEFKGAKRDNGMVSTDGYSIPKGKQFWVSGHLHTKQTFPRLVYPGTMGQINVVEGQEKFFLHLTVHKQKVDCQFIPYDPPWKIFNLVISKLSDLEQVAKNKNHAYRLILKAGVELPDGFGEGRNIYKQVGYRDKRSLRAALQDTLDIEDNPAEQMNPLYGLPEYLQDKGHKSKAVKRLYRLAEEIAEKVA